MTDLMTCEGLDTIQSRMYSAVDVQVEIPVQHMFIPGIYARRVLIKAGELVAGRIHKTEHISVISAGRVEVVTENVFTGEIRSDVYEAPCQFVSPAGTKRMVKATENTIWTTFHRYDGPPDEDGITDWFSWKDRNAYLLLTQPRGES